MRKYEFYIIVAWLLFRMVFHSINFSASISEPEIVEEVEVIEHTEYEDQEGYGGQEGYGQEMGGGIPFRHGARTRQANP